MLSLLDKSYEMLKFTGGANEWNVLSNFEEWLKAENSEVFREWQVLEGLQLICFRVFVGKLLVLLTLDNCNPFSALICIQNDY